MAGLERLRQAGQPPGEPEEAIPLALEEKYVPGTIEVHHGGGQLALGRLEVGLQEHFDPEGARKRRHGMGEVAERVEPGGACEARVESPDGFDTVEPKGTEAASEVAPADDIPAAPAVGEAVGVEIALG